MKTTPKTHRNDTIEHLNHAGSVLLAFSAAGIAGAVIGIALAEYLRARELTWTWALPLAPMSAAVSAGLIYLGADATHVAVALGFGVGATCGSLGWGVRRRLDDRREAGDREAAARERRGLLDGLRSRVTNGRLLRGDGLDDAIAIGTSNRGELASIKRGTPGSGSHVLIPGATGAGKTTTLAALLVSYVAESGFGAVVFEAKIDEGLRAAAEAAATARGVPFRLISADGPCSYDPLAKGSVDERAERLIAVEDWGSADADFYRQASSPLLRLLIEAMDAGGVRTTLRSVAERCDSDELENLSGDLSDERLSEEITRYTNSLGADERRAVAGLRARIFNFSQSGFARRWLDPEAATGHVVDLRESVRQREVVYFRLDTDRTGNVGRVIAQMALLDLGAAASSMMENGVGTLIAIDEFGALSSSAVDRLYTRGRSAGMSVAVGTQTVADFLEAGGSTRERIGATIESIVCHRIGNHDDAEWVAGQIGTVPTWQSTVKTDALGLPNGEGTRSRGYRFEIHPSQLQRLGTGEAYVARLDSVGSRRAVRVEVVPAWERLPGIERAA